MNRVAQSASNKSDHEAKLRQQDFKFLTGQIRCTAQCVIRSDGGLTSSLTISITKPAIIEITTK